MRTIILTALLLATPAVAADEPTLNDLPAILYKLRGCTESHSLLGGTTITCRIRSEDLWASVQSDGHLTLFRNRSYGDTTYARGDSVGALLRDFAQRINDDSTANKAMLDALAPYLPTQ